MHVSLAYFIQDAVTADAFMHIDQIFEALKGSPPYCVCLLWFYSSFMSLFFFFLRDFISVKQVKVIFLFLLYITIWKQRNGPLIKLIFLKQY